MDGNKGRGSLSEDSVSVSAWVPVSVEHPGKEEPGDGDGGGAAPAGLGTRALHPDTGCRNFPDGKMGQMCSLVYLGCGRFQPRTPPTHSVLLARWWPEAPLCGQNRTKSGWAFLAPKTEIHRHRSTACKIILFNPVQFSSPPHCSISK